MLNNEILKLLNEQINKELYSAYIYLDMANYYSEKGLNGFENWFYVQAKEEMDHAMLFRTYILNNDSKVILQDISTPQFSFADFREPLAEALKHEQYVTASINNIYEVAQQQKDYRTVEFLNWFIKEQGEEEKNVTDLINMYDVFSRDSLIVMNQQLAARVYAPPSLVL